MNLYDNSTYPPPTTMTSVPPPPTASTGFSGSNDWLFPAVLVLAIVGAAALRIARRKI